MPTQLSGHTVYILGAGASAHTNAPLLGNFLVAARVVREEGRALTYRAAFDNVFTWIDDLRASSYYVEFDLDNLEHVFSLAELARQIGVNGADEIARDLGYVIMETLDQLTLNWQPSGQIEPDDLYVAFLTRLQEVNDAREDRTRKALSAEGKSFHHDVIVTFNYDVMLDYAMMYRRVGPDYKLAGKPAPQGGIPLLKLHGSMNWANCRACGPQAPLQVVPPTPVPAGQHVVAIDNQARPISFRMVTDVLAKTPCAQCGAAGVLEPFVVPPTWSKRIESQPVAPVWSAAINAIKECAQLVVIGYSLPPTDTFFQYLLTLGVKDNPRLHRVIVIDSDQRPEFGERYRRVFSRSLHDRHRLLIDRRSFESFIGQRMHQISEDPYVS